MTCTCRRVIGGEFDEILVDVCPSCQNLQNLEEVEPDVCPACGHQLDNVVDGIGFCGRCSELAAADETGFWPGELERVG